MVTQKITYNVECKSYIINLMVLEILCLSTEYQVFNPLLLCIEQKQCITNQFIKNVVLVYSLEYEETGLVSNQ